MGFGRMVPGVIGMLIITFTLIIFFSVFIHPLLYTADSLNTAYEEISSGGDPDAWTSPSDFKATLLMIIWCFIGAVAIGILLLFVYLYALAHKQEYDIRFVR